MSDVKMTVANLIESLDTFPQHLPVVVEGRVDHDGRAEIDDIQVALSEGMEEVHLIMKRRQNGS